jgi:hypothetical protein
LFSFSIYLVNTKAKQKKPLKFTNKKIKRASKAKQSKAKQSKAKQSFACCHFSGCCVLYKVLIII